MTTEPTLAERKPQMITDSNEQIDVPPPGSKEAVELGCKCPVIDNHYGRGIGEINGRMMYVISGDCPLHSIKSIVEGFWREP